MKPSIPRFVPLVFVTLLTVATALPVQDKKNDKNRPAMVGPKRSVSVLPFDIRLTQGSGSSGVSFGGGFNNTSANGASSDGTISIPNPAEFGSGLATVMITALTDSRGFSVIEMDEPPANGALVQTPASASKPQYIVRAVVTEMTCRQRSGGISIGGIGAGQGQYENKIVIDARLIDPVTYAVIESVTATGKKTSKGSIFQATKYAGGSMWFPATKVLDLTLTDFQASPLADASRLAVEDAVKKLIEKASKRAWEAYVIRVIQEDTGPEVYLDVESDCGLKNGDSLDLCQPGEELTDPKTGRVVGRARPKVLGRLTVFQTDADRVICKPVAELADKPELLAAGLLVRLTPKP